jgi:serine/threonine-protein kinase
MDPGGRQLAGRYRLEEVIGRGGMSTVYRATDAVLGRTVAVKVLLAGLAEEDPAYIARFQREARAAAALHNRAVVAVYDVGVDDDARFIVMEHVKGRSLAALLSGGKPLPLQESLRVGQQVASALGAAHAVGIVHRDIKPANVMVADDGSVKVLDFGVARMLDGTTITQAASVLGTAAYMAPERAMGEPGDARADVYSLGCLLYAMLTGAPPFRAEHAAALLHQHVNASPRPAGDLRAGVPPELDALVADMLAKAPEDRPQNAARVGERLRAMSEPADPTAPTARLAPAAPLVASPATAPTRVLAGPPPPGRRRRRGLAAALGAAAVALIVVLLSSSGGSPRTTPAATTRSTTHSAGTATTQSAPAATTQSAPAATTAPTTPSPAKPQPPAALPGGPPGHGKRPPPGHPDKHHDKGKAKGPNH